MLNNFERRRGSPREPWSAQPARVSEAYSHSHERAPSNVTAENKNVCRPRSEPSYNEAHTLAGNLRRDHGEQIWEGYRSFIRPWSLGAGANSARRNSHRGSYRLANQFWQCTGRAIISCQFGERSSSQWQDHRQGWSSGERKGHECQVKGTPARAWRGHHPAHFDPTQGWQNSDGLNQRLSCQGQEPHQ